MRRFLSSAAAAAALLVMAAPALAQRGFAGKPGPVNQRVEMRVGPMEIIRDDVELCVRDVAVKPCLAKPRCNAPPEGRAYRHSERALSIASREPLSEK